MIEFDKNLLDPRDVKPTEFGKAEMQTEGDGKNKPFMLSMNQCAPRHAEDPGGDMPSDWSGDARSAIVERNFKPMQAPNSGTSVSIPESVSFETGMIKGGY